MNYVVKGFLFMTKRRHFTDAAIYGDWVGATFEKSVLKEDLYFGRLPEGLILSGPHGCEVVIGRNGQRNQKLVPITTFLGIPTEDQKDKGPINNEANKIADHLKDLRILLGLTQIQLAYRLDLSPSTISQIEGGYHGFEAETAEKLMKLYPLYQEYIHG